MRTVCNRFNSQKVITMVQLYGSPMTFDKRWQVTVVDERGRHYDHYFVAKPTRKQIRKLHKVKHVYINKRCYECGERIRIEQVFTWLTLDDLNYAHVDCVFGAKK